MKNQNIKMRINKNKASVCDFCSETWENVPEMYDMMLVKNMYTICKKCTQELFMKILHADSLYNGKVKSTEDLAREKNFENKYGFSIHTAGYQIK